MTCAVRGMSAEGVKPQTDSPGVGGMRDPGGVVVEGDGRGERRGEVGGERHGDIMFPRDRVLFRLDRVAEGGRRRGGVGAGVGQGRGAAGILLGAARRSRSAQRARRKRAHQAGHPPIALRASVQPHNEERSGTHVVSPISIRRAGKERNAPRRSSTAPTHTLRDRKQRPNREQAKQARNERNKERGALWNRINYRKNVYSIFHPISARIRSRPFSPIRDRKSSSPNSCISSTTRLAATEKIHRAAATCIIVPIDSASFPSPRALP